MITDYYRPETLPEALGLLKDPDTLPLGGGTLLSTLKSASVKVVDLQARCGAVEVIIHVDRAAPARCLSLPGSAQRSPLSGNDPFFFCRESRHGYRAENKKKYKKYKSFHGSIPSNFDNY